MEAESRKLLLIDYSEIVLAFETELLSNAGFEVRAVSSLRGFLDALLDWKPQVLLTDLLPCRRCLAIQLRQWPAPAR